MPNDITTHIKSAAAHLARGARAVGRIPRAKDRKALRSESRPSIDVKDVKRVRFDDEVGTGEPDVVATESDTAEREGQWPEAMECLQALSLSSKNYTKYGKHKDQSQLRHFALQKADGLYRTCTGIPADIRLAIDTHLKDCRSHTLRTILRNAVHANYAASFYKVESDEERLNRGLVMKLVVEACLDRLAETEKVVPLPEHRPRINREALQYAHDQWVKDPSKTLVRATKHGAFGELYDFIEKLVPGYKAFGRDGVAVALVEEFKHEIASPVDARHQNLAREGTLAWDKAIAKIRRRGAALERIATTEDLLLTARIMQQVYWSYHLAKTPDAEPAKLVADARAPTASDEEWAQTYLLSKDPSAALSGQPTRGEVRRIARWLVEALSNRDLPTATYALKALVALGWPNQALQTDTTFSKEKSFELLFREALSPYRRAYRLDWDPWLAQFFRMTATYLTREGTDYAADLATAARSIVEAYKKGSERDPLNFPGDARDEIVDQCCAILEKPHESFADIHRYLTAKENLSPSVRPKPDTAEGDLDFDDRDEAQAAFDASLPLIVHEDLLGVAHFEPPKLESLPRPQTVVIQDMPPLQHGVRVEEEANYHLGTKSLPEELWQLAPRRSAEPLRSSLDEIDFDAIRNEKLYSQNAPVMDEITSLMMELTRPPRLVQPGSPLLQPASHLFESAKPATQDTVQRLDSDPLGEEAARAARVTFHDRIIAAAERSDIRALIDGLDTLSTIDEGRVDGVFTELTDALAAWPEKTRQGFAMLYDAIDTAAARLDNEGHPSYGAPRFLRHAEAIRNRLVESLDDVWPESVDEGLIEAARQALLANRIATIDEVLAELERPASPLVQRVKLDAQREIDGGGLQVSQVKLGAEELRGARLTDVAPEHLDLDTVGKADRTDMIERTFNSLLRSDTESYREALKSLSEMDAITTPLAIQGSFLEREPATQRRISLAARAMHQSLVARGTDAATLELSQQIVETVKEVATPGRATGIDTASEKPVGTIVPPSRLNGARPKAAIPPTSPQRNTRPKPPLIRTKRGELPRTVPQDGPGNRAAVTPADAMRDAIDQANVLGFLKALHALAQLEGARRAERYLAIRRALENKPPQQSSIERLNALMMDIDMETQGPVRERFLPIDRVWLVLQSMVPDLKVAFRSSAGQGDLNTALTFLAGLSTAGDASPAKPN